MSSLMSAIKNNKEDLGPIIDSKESLTVSAYPKGDKGATFIPKITGGGPGEPHTMSWTNDQNLVNPAPINFKGEAATISVGSVQQGASPSVVNSGTENDAILDFVIPNATVAAGTVQRGSPLAVTNTGTSKDAVLNFVIPDSLVAINGAAQPATTPFYAPTTSGTTGQILSSSGAGNAPIWEPAPLKYIDSGASVQPTKWTVVGSLPSNPDPETIYLIAPGN